MANLLSSGFQRTRSTLGVDGELATWTLVHCLSYIAVLSDAKARFPVAAVFPHCLSQLGGVIMLYAGSVV